MAERAARITIIQPGARLHYAVPRIFAEAGLLNCLYTDIHAEHWPFRTLAKILPESLRPKALRRLLGRKLPDGLPLHEVRDTPLRSLLQPLAGRFELLRSCFGSGASSLLNALESNVYGEHDIIYTVLVNEDVEVMNRLRGQGARIVYECILGPDVGLWLCDEATRYPGLEDVAPRSDEGRTRDRMKLAAVDLVLAPSEFTRRAIFNLAEADKSVELVPYGLDLDQVDMQCQGHQPGRVLMAGTVGLRKGSHHFAAASRELKRRGVPAHCIAAGPIPRTVKRTAAFDGPTYLGQVPRSEIGKEFRSADVFVLPAIAEGFPLAHLEALAHGVPVITTPNCGSAVRNGVEGFIVPIRDPNAIADRVEDIVTNRELRDRMSRAARARAAEFSLEKYAERLIGAVQSVM